ncbi:hypothetical protein J3459_014268 [Metarhizium acridum]|nr:hypothetical protein J3459_014268 [Metarhizium acridum]
MDPELFAFAQLELPKLELESLITDDVEALVGDVQDIQATTQFFFETVHTWMPIVSKNGFSQSLIKRMTHQRAELFLLVLSMKLCSSRVTNARTNLYRTARRLYADIERSGTLSLLVLQAGILIALYEMGHGLYPDAYLSVAQCARYGTALGVDKTIISREMGTTTLPDLEEARRVWWSILVLDRFMNLCDPMRHLVTADPDSTSYLPIDDEEWDSGTSGAEHAFTLGSAISLRLGRFARFAQAAHLLSQVLHQVADKSTDTTQLRRTIFSLVNVSRIEADMRQLELLASCFLTTRRCYPKGINSMARVSYQAKPRRFCKPL